MKHEIKVLLIWLFAYLKMDTCLNSKTNSNIHTKTYVRLRSTSMKVTPWFLKKRWQYFQNSVKYWNICHNYFHQYSGQSAESIPILRSWTLVGRIYAGIVQSFKKKNVHPDFTCHLLPLHVTWGISQIFQFRVPLTYGYSQSPKLCFQSISEVVFRSYDPHMPSRQWHILELNLG